MLSIKSISKAYAGRTLFSGASLQINRRDRIGIVGPNGAGKSTLFSIILGEITPDEGEIALEKGAKVGFLPQESAPTGDETVLELACSFSPDFIRAAKRMGALGQAPEGEPTETDYEVFESAGGRRPDCQGPADSCRPEFQRQRHDPLGQRVKRRLDNARPFGPLTG